MMSQTKLVKKAEKHIRTISLIGRNNKEGCGPIDMNLEVSRRQYSSDAAGAVREFLGGPEI